MTVLGRLTAVFVEPAAESPRAPAPQSDPHPHRGPRLVAVLAPEDDLAATAGGVAATLRRTHSARVAVVVGFLDTAPRAATPAAGALARRLAARDLTATAAGTLVRVSLAADPREAAREIERVLVTAEVPVVVALPKRLDGLDHVLERLDQLVLALPTDVDGALADLALASLATVGPTATRTCPPAGMVTRRLAALGVINIPLEHAAEPDDEPASAAPAAVTAPRPAGSRLVFAPPRPAAVDQRHPEPRP
jgi:hypothetical protein